MNTIKPLLVTGSHRSGTTWVGKMLASTPQLGYIHEPFNPLHRPGTCAATFPYWFAYVTEENEAPFYLPLKQTLKFHFALGADLAATRAPIHVARMAKNFSNFSLYRLRHATPLLKDPIALFSAEWLARRFDMNVVVLIRHPAAFASSLRRLNWKHDFANFVNQPLLMKEQLQPFEAEIIKFAEQEQDILDQAILLWRIMHYMIAQYQKAHEDWVFLRHEDLSQDPSAHFEHLFKQFNLHFSKHVQTVIQDYSGEDNPTDAKKGHTFTKRDSKSNIKSWKKKLTEDEITHIRTGVEDISSAFYANSDW